MNTIHEYIYNKKNKVSKNRRIVGVFTTSFINNDTVGIGWALCNRNDSFDKVKGLSIAKGRAFKNSITPVPISIIGDYIKFLDRCHRYYQDKDIANPIRTFWKV